MKQTNPSLVCLRCTVLCLEKASAHRGLRREEHTGGVVSSGRSSKVTQFKYFGRNYPEVARKPPRVLGDSSKQTMLKDGASFKGPHHRGPDTPTYIKIMTRGYKANVMEEWLSNFNLSLTWKRTWSAIIRSTSVV